MVVPLLVSTFTAVFLAELGDKTQFAIVALSGSSKKPLAVFIGSSAALMLSSLIGATAGGAMAAVIPRSLLELLASFGFLLIGGRLLLPLFSKSETNSKEIE